MNNRAAKRALAVALAGAMAFANPLAVFAADNSVDSTGSGNYEGDTVAYPSVTVATLPTIGADTYKYWIDPNGLIASTEGAAYESGSTFSSDGKFWFLSDEKKYTADSKAVSFTSENAKDMDVTVKLEVTNKDSVSEGIGFSTDKTFANDTKTDMYIAIVDTDTDTDTKKADVPLEGMDKAVSMTKTIAGKPSNYKLGHTTSGYAYALDSSISNPTWNSFEYKLTGAINTATGVKWDGVTTMPEIKVTWSWAEHTDAYVSSTSVSTSSNSVTLSMPSGESISSIVMSGGNTNVTLTEGTHYTVSGTTLTFPTDKLGNWIGAGHNKLTITFSDNHTEVLTMQ